MAYTVTPSPWDDDDFLACSASAQRTYLYLRDCRHAEGMPPGLLVIGVRTIADDLHAPIDEVDAQLAELTERGLIQVDGRVVRVLRGPWYKFPHNPKTVAGWYRRWSELPSCTAKFEHLMTMRLAMVERRLNETTLAEWDRRFGPEFTAWSRRDRGAPQPLPALAPPLVEGEIAGSHAPVSTPIPGSSRRSRDLVSDLRAIRVNPNNKPSSSSSSSDTVSIPYRYGPLGEGEAEGQDDSDLDQGSGIREGEREREGGRSRLARGTVEGDLAVPIAEPVSAPARLFARQESLRHALGLQPADHDLRRIEAALSRYTPEQLDHALAVFHADAVRDRAKRRFLNGVSNWSFAALAHAVGRPVDPGERPLFDGVEQYAGGEVL